MIVISNNIDVLSLHKDDPLEHSNKSKGDEVMDNEFESISEDNNEDQEHEQGNGSNVKVYNLRDRSNIKKSLRYDNSAFIVVESDPVNFKEAVGSQNLEKWIEAMNNEMDSLVNCGWVYKTKYNVHGLIDIRLG